MPHKQPHLDLTQQSLPKDRFLPKSFVHPWTCSPGSKPKEPQPEAAAELEEKAIPLNFVACNGKQTLRTILTSFLRALRMII